MRRRKRDNEITYVQVGPSETDRLRDWVENVLDPPWRPPLPDGPRLDDEGSSWCGPWKLVIWDDNYREVERQVWNLEAGLTVLGEYLRKKGYA